MPDDPHLVEAPVETPMEVSIETPSGITVSAPVPRMTARQRRFCDEYLKDFNATAAALRAGFKPSRAGHRGFELLKFFPAVRATIAAALAERREREAEEREKLIRQFERLVYADPRALFHADGSAKRIEELDDETAAAVASIDVEESYSERDGRAILTGRVARIRLADRIAAMSKLAEILHLTGPAMRFLQVNATQINLSAIPVDPQEAARAYARLVGGNGA